MNIIKYLGSKSKLSKQIVPIIQECINKNKVNTYIEPFVGGANIIDKIKYKKSIYTKSKKSRGDLNERIYIKFRHTNKS